MNFGSAQLIPRCLLQSLAEPWTHGSSLFLLVKLFIYRVRSLIDDKFKMPISTPVCVLWGCIWYHWNCKDLTEILTYFTPRLETPNCHKMRLTAKMFAGGRSTIFTQIVLFIFFFRAPIYQSNIIFIRRKFHWNWSKHKGDMNCYLSTISWFQPNLEKCHFWAILGNYWQFSDMGKKFLKMDYTKFLVFNFMFLLSKALKNSQGKKIFIYLFLGL